MLGVTKTGEVENTTVPVPVSSEIKVASSADVKGSLQTSNLIVDKGAVITARIKMRQA